MASTDTFTLSNTTALRFVVRDAGGLVAAVDAGGSDVVLTRTPPQVSEGTEPFLAQTVYTVSATVAGTADERIEVPVGTITVSITTPDDISGAMVWSLHNNIDSRFKPPISATLNKLFDGSRAVGIAISNPDGIAAATSAAAAVGSPTACAIHALQGIAERARNVYVGVDARAAARAALCA
jgi:hypothetical protein